MPLYKDPEGHLYWHDRIAATLAPVAPTEQQAAHGIRPKIARIRSDRTGWLQQGSLGLMAASLALAALSIPVASHDWPLSLGLAVLGFLVAAFAKIFFIETLCSQRVRFDRSLTLVPVQPWGPGLLGLALVLSLTGPVYVLTWEKGLDGMGGPSVLSALVWVWLVWRQGRRWGRMRRAVASTVGQGSADAST